MFPEFASNDFWVTGEVSCVAGLWWQPLLVSFPELCDFSYPLSRMVDTMFLCL